MKTVILILALVAVQVTDILAQTNQPPRLAIICEDASAMNVADSLGAILSQDDKVALVERAQINRVLQEQVTSAANQNPLALGKILNADGLLLMEIVKQGSNQFLGVHLVAAKPGVLLSSERFSWPLEEPLPWANGISDHLKWFLPKLTVLTQDAIPLSVVNFRSAVQSPAGRQLEHQLTLLFNERLSREKQIFVLERRKMQFLSTEKELAALDNSAFWEGAYLLDGTIDRDGYSQANITLHVRMIPPKGGVPLQMNVSCSRTNLSEALNQLTAAVLAHLKLTQTPTSWNPADEAEQYYEDAKWAFRWHLHQQAQTASETAWALGGRTKDLALLRIRAYTDSILPAEDTGIAGIQIPAVPDPSKLQPAMRALELFCNETARSTALNPALDVEQYDLGVKTLRTASRLLEGFYYKAEMRRGYETKLAELRSLARQTAARLKAGKPAELKLTPKWPSEASTASQDLEDLIWQENGVWQDTPEDALPAFTELLENDFHPTFLPRIVGWSWPDRKRVPHILKDFVAQLCASTNPLLRLEGHYLELVRTPDDVEGGLDTVEQKLLAEIWSQQRIVLNNPGAFSLMARAEAVLTQKKYYGRDLNKRLEDPPLTALMHRLRREYLGSYTNYDRRQFYAVVRERAAFCSRGEAAELIPLVEEFRNRTKTNDFEFKITVSALQFVAGTNAVAATRPNRVRNQAVVWPTEHPLGVDFIEWKFKGEGEIRPQEMIIRDGELWCWAFRYQEDPLVSFFDSSRSFFKVNPATGLGVEIPFPPQLAPVRYQRAGSSFEVMDGSLYASAPNRLLRYRLQEQRWEEIPVPVEGQAKIIGLNARLYLTTEAGLLELDPKSNSVQVLVSSRRRPAENELDGAWSDSVPPFVRSDGQLGVRVANGLFSFDPRSRKWSGNVEFPKPSDRWIELFSGEGVHLLPIAPYRKRELIAYWNDQTRPELLLEQRNPRAAKTTTNEPSYGPPRWKWPEPFRLDMPYFFAEAKSLWMVHPRALPWVSEGNPGAEPIAFQDTRHATLLSFTPERSECLQTPLTIRKDGQPINLFDRQHMQWLGTYFFRAPTCMATKEGFIIVDPDFGGHWFISKATLQANLKPLPAPMPTPGGQTNSTAPLKP
jgi:hypothetical protein